MHHPLSLAAIRSGRVNAYSWESRLADYAPRMLAKQVTYDLSSARDEDPVVSFVGEQDPTRPGAYVIKDGAERLITYRLITSIQVTVIDRKAG